MGAMPTIEYVVKKTLSATNWIRSPCEARHGQGDAYKPLSQPGRISRGHFSIALQFMRFLLATATKGD